MPPDMIRPVAGRGQVVGPGQAGDAVEDDARRRWPSSTMRLARSMVSSATWVCSSDGRSNVDAATSPVIEPLRKSVTSSGRSSTSSTMRCTSGWLTSIDRAICFITVVLPALGGDTMRPRWPFPIGRDQVDDPRRHVGRVVGQLQLELLVGEQRREVLEAAPVAGLLGVLAVDRVDAQQRRVLLVAAGGPAGALEVVALAQAELADLLDRHVHVVLRRQVALHAEEAVALVAQVEEALDVDGLADELLGGRLALAGLLVAGLPLGLAAAALLPCAALRGALAWLAALVGWPSAVAVAVAAPAPAAAVAGLAVVAALAALLPCWPRPGRSGRGRCGRRRCALLALRAARRDRWRRGRCGRGCRGPAPARRSSASSAVELPLGGRSSSQPRRRRAR